MVKFMIPSHLIDLLPKDDHFNRSSFTAVSLNPGPWDELIQEIHERFPLLAARILKESGGVATGFVLAVNDNIIRIDPATLDLRSGDEFSIIAAMAGG